jgi:chemotaxis protein histidine kinase CheA
VLVVGSSVLLLGALVAGIAIKLHRDAEAAAWAAAEARVAVEVTAQQADERFFATQDAAATAAAHEAQIAAAVAQAGTVISGAQGTLAASPHAGDQNLAALQQATDAVSASAASIGKGTSLAALRATQQAVQAPQQAAAEAQAAWQAAEDARIAAERAAAEQAAAAAAAQRSASRQSTPRAARSTGSAPAAAAAPAAEAPASGWVAGVESYGVSGLGAAINAQRAANGLPALSVGGSSSLADHAAEMAAAGSIWHSGRDHIVGWVQPVSAEQMIQAYMNSPSHRAWILKEGKTKVSIGAVTYNGRLYTAMVFS